MPFTPLSDSGESSTGAYDVRGWAVRTMADGRDVGSVLDVLLDGAGGAARYLDVELRDGGGRILVPVDEARVDEAEDVVWLPGLERADVRRIPTYGGEPGTITGEYEARMRRAYASAGDREERAPAGAEERIAGDGGVRLSSMDDVQEYRIAEGDPDPRGWDVIVADGRSIGKVDQLIVDTSVMKVRFLDCALDEESLGMADRGRHVLVPVGYARLNEDQEQVIVDSIASEDVANLPEFGGLPVRREEEDRLHEVFTGGRRGQERRSGHGPAG